MIYKKIKDSNIYLPKFFIGIIDQECVKNKYEIFKTKIRILKIYFQYLR